jgi:hypothetical protein
LHPPEDSYCCRGSKSGLETLETYLSRESNTQP